MRSLSIASSGMLAQQTNVDVISHNIANMNTTGFKRQRAEFQDLLYQQELPPGAGGDTARAPSGIQIGAGVKTGAVYRIEQQGPLQQTGNRYDMAIEGRGYLPVTLPSGETAYTRDGSFQLSDQGEMVTAQGYPLQPGITIPQDALEVTISKTGEVQVRPPATPPRRRSASFSSPPSSTMPGWRRRATTCSSKAPPPARRASPTPANRASARCNRVSSRDRTSTRSRRSRRSSPPSAPMR